MKFKPSNKGGGVMVELSTNEVRLPGEEECSEVSALFRLNKILVPMDFSDCSKKALQYAVPFSKHFGAELIVVYVLPYPLHGLETSLVDANTIEDSKRALIEMLQQFSKTIKSTVVVRMGNPWAEIVEAAGEFEVDMITLATHGKSGLAHVLLGSTAERVVRHAPCPVLVVRQKEHEFVVASPDDPAPEA